jgi:hypothetical protein
MTNIRKTIHNIFVWSYDRGTLQYDIICALILAFVFFVPPSCFVVKRAGKLHPAAHQTTKVATQNFNGDVHR